MGTAVKQHSGVHFEIKLPRSTVRECLKKSGRSLSFSHENNDLEGRHVTIYCTEDGEISDKVRGTVKRVSHKSAKRWIVVASEIVLSSLVPA